MASELKLALEEACLEAGVTLKSSFASPKVVSIYSISIAKCRIIGFGALMCDRESTFSRIMGGKFCMLGECSDVITICTYFWSMS